MTQREIERRRRLRREKRRREVRRQRAILAMLVCYIAIVIVAVATLANMPEVQASSQITENKTVIESTEMTEEATEQDEEVAEASTEATEEVQEISGTQVLEGEVVEEATESSEVADVTEETTEATETTEVVEATESTAVATASAWMNYTSADVNLLANIMYAEEGVLYTMYYDTNPADVETTAKLCGSVVLHRLANNMGGATTIREVLYAEGQYAGTTKTRIENGQDIPELFYVWAEDLLRDGPLGPNNLVFQAEFAQGTVYATYWNQIFCTSPYYPE